ncbi:MAG: hypothetical protein LBF40_11115 [Deltaproteobacteria bacterium]|jgi:hypothetical protein|nr:hypothetical protein [Deltaproteobacteria bacterium]
MTKKVTTMFATMIMFVGTIFVLNAAITPANAQVPGLTLPVLTDSDFTNFLEIYPTMTKDPASLPQTLAAKGIDMLHFNGIVAKIVANVQGLISADALTQAKATYGDSVALNSEEQGLFDKYKDKLVALVTPPTAQ